MKHLIKTIRNARLFLTISILLISNVVIAQSEYSIDFAHNNGYIHINDNSVLDINSAGTIESWIEISAFPSSGQVSAAIIHKGDLTNENDKAYSLLIYSDNKIGLSFFDASSIEHSIKTTSTFTVGYCGHISATWNGSEIKIYVNGSLDNSATCSAYPRITTAGVNVGAKFTSNYNQTYKNYAFNGKIDEVRIWNIELNQIEIQTRMYESITSATESQHQTEGGTNHWINLVGYWGFETGNNTTVVDNSSNSNNGIFIVAPLTNNLPEWSYPGFPMAKWIGSTSNNWNTSSNWSTGIVPDENYNAVIGCDNRADVNDNKSCHNLVILPSASLTISLTKTLTVNGDLTIKTSDTMVGSLINYGDIVIVGTSTFERFIERDGWHYISSPISNGSTNLLWGAAVYSYSESYDRWESHGSGESLTPMKGFDVYYRYDQIIKFRGTLNKSNYTTTVANYKTGWNFVGNPYPSTIDWDATSGWIKTYIENSIYFWDADLETYVAYVGGSGINGGSRYIPPTQAFWVKCNSPYGTGTLGMTPAIRVHDNYSKFRTEKVNNELKIKLSGNNYSDETVIRFNENASEDFDNNFDAEKMFSSNVSVPQIYSTFSSEEIYSINTLQNLNNDVSVPLLVKIGVAGKYKFTFLANEFNEGVNIFIEDKYENRIHNLNSGTYIFNSISGTFEDRFVIHFLKSQIIADNNTNKSNSIEEDNSFSPIIYSFEKNIYIDMSTTELSEAQLCVYNTLGQKIISEEINGHQMSKISIEDAVGYYIVKLITEEKTYSEKIYLTK
ncbi:MAG: LamG-like jellyroll fold domain-containing protein [Bacteroidota bacterium]|nr:LamG-like jellyroll fold domain-containing protein [Bacteroidota bacterium]